RALLAANGGVAGGAERSLRGVATTALLLLFRTGRGRPTMGGCGTLGRQTVFHQLDMHSAGNALTVVGGRLRRGLICCRRIVAGHFRGLLFDVSVAQCYSVHTVDGNVMFTYEVALDRFCLALGARDTCGTCC